MGFTFVRVLVPCPVQGRSLFPFPASLRWPELRPLLNRGGESGRPCLVPPQGEDFRLRRCRRFRDASYHGRVILLYSHFSESFSLFFFITNGCWTLYNAFPPPTRGK